MQSVVETRAFQIDAKAAGMNADEVFALISYLAATPDAGEVMVGTGGARKLRWRRPGSGKSGGYRIITFYAGRDVPVFLLNAFTKGERANLSQAERNTLAAILPRLADAYRSRKRV
ncbi:MAG TPA: type II toxin-antitoxin system RelE/ParE family toxin [Roseomonas sp.]|jgi:hypothetical protein